MRHSARALGSLRAFAHRHQLSGSPLCKGGSTTEYRGVSSTQLTQGSARGHKSPRNPILVGCVRFSTSSKNAHTPREHPVHDVSWCYLQRGVGGRSPPKNLFFFCFLLLRSKKTKEKQVWGCALNGCHQWVCEGTWFPHAPLCSGVCMFCSYAAKHTNPTRMGWHAPGAFFASRKRCAPQVTPVEGLRPKAKKRLS